MTGSTPQETKSVDDAPQKVHSLLCESIKRERERGRDREREIERSIEVIDFLHDKNLSNV